MRITPAQAGKSFLRVDVHEIPGDHPRAGGEKPFADLIQKQMTRITPAQAGKRLILFGAKAATRDHPRAGGEKPEGNLQRIVRRGSPPHGRGKDWLCNESAPLSGITPAWAGKSVTVVHNRIERRDHPRMGGEKKI